MEEVEVTPVDDEPTRESLPVYGPELPPTPKKAKRRMSRFERSALLLTVFVWTAAVWAALIIALMLDDQQLWRQLWSDSEAAVPVTATSWLPAQSRDQGQATPTPTRVVQPETISATTMTPTPTITSPVSLLRPPNQEAQAASIVQPPATVEPPAPEVLVEPTPVFNWPPPVAPPPTLTPDEALRTPSRIVIDSVAIDEAIIPVGWETVERDGQPTSAWIVADDAVGWHQNSALPGDPDNLVLSGHSNIGGEVFRSLGDIQQGAEIVLLAGDQEYRYQVTETTIVKEAGESPETRLKNARWIAPTGAEQLTLVTCWPYPLSTHRFIVVASPL